MPQAMENKSAILHPKTPKNSFSSTRQISSGPGIFFLNICFVDMFWNHLHFNETILWSHSAIRIDSCVRESLVPYAINTDVSTCQIFLLWPYLPKPQLPIGPTEIKAGFHFGVGFFGFPCCYFWDLFTHTILSVKKKKKKYKASQTLTYQNSVPFRGLSQNKMVILFFKYDILILSLLCCFSVSF